MQGSGTSKHVVILDGPIGVGKTTFGCLLAKEFAGKFLDGDDFSAPDKPWYASSLSTNRRIFEAATAAMETTSVVFVAYPMRCLNWIYLSRKFQSVQIDAHFVGLQASLKNIVGEGRDRQLSAAEIERTKEMIAQGYGARPFCTCFIQTDAGNVNEVTDLAASLLRKTLSI